ncbi:MAG: cell wall metabolism sensor histidine kinase WalK [Candidatus Mcinerneyibacterium aminivorans]|uniref:histidine kinase n=1 Tax=Candidatus Mcinerneyibacterium aminivorans TaxID=2703815 RepID=A0A5D0MGN4_9BACT|nr:MAG: cell wall metabolism sensor histidine kinase WalK [Candidatus Mcinerneyibacterium aminivorans]
MFKIKSIYLKIFISFLLLIAVITGFFLYFSYNTIYNNYIDSKTESLKKINYFLESTVSEFIDNPESLDKKIKELGNKTDVRITIVKKNGEVIADSFNNPKNMENHKNRIELVNSLDKGSGKAVRYSETEDKRMLYVAITYNENEEVKAFIRSSLYLDDIKTTINELFERIFVISILIIVFSLLGAYIFAKTISHPIKRLTEASSEVAEGNFDVKVYLNKKDEFGVLANSFNYMTERINRLFSEVRENQKKLEAIIESIQELLFVINNEGKIKLSNNNFKKYFKIDDSGDKSFYEIISEPDMIELFEKIKKNKTNLVKEIEMDDKIFLVSLSYVRESEDIIGLLHDLTEYRMLNKIKKDFVYNVSHELKTPLTSIKGFSETLLSNKNFNKNYIQIIKKNTDRMIKIVKDLLTLSELEINQNIKKEKVNLEDPIENAFVIVKEKAENKGLKLSKKLPGDEFIIEGDKFKLEQLFINLLDNAVKYTNKGSVRISARELNDDRVQVIIEDTGIGIAKKHLNRIFERFYVVDKSRSRKKGGTGLGLSIVKHILKLHDAEMDVQSKKNKGTKFTIFFNKKI